MFRGKLVPPKVSARPLDSNKTSKAMETDIKCLDYVSFPSFLDVHKISFRSRFLLFRFDLIGFVMTCYCFSDKISDQPGRPAILFLETDRLQKRRGSQFADSFFLRQLSCGFGTE